MNRRASEGLGVRQSSAALDGAHPFESGRGLLQSRTLREVGSWSRFMRNRERGFPQAIKEGAVAFSNRPEYAD